MKTHYKPLWAVHNRTYRYYSKGLAWKNFRRYLGKAKRILLRSR